MNDFFSWRRKLNMKKVIIVSIIIAILVIILTSFIISKYVKHKKEQKLIEEENAKPNKIYTSQDNSFSIELPKSYNLMQIANSNEYLLDLISNDNLGIHISKRNFDFENKDFHSIVKADRLAFSQSFGTCSNLSDLKEILVGDTKGYTYSFHYLDTELNKAFYLQIIWLNINNNYYIFDIDFPLDDLSFYTNIVTDVLASFKILSK